MIRFHSHSIAHVHLRLFSIEKLFNVLYIDVVFFCNLVQTLLSELHLRYLYFEILYFSFQIRVHNYTNEDNYLQINRTTKQN
jgi:hypothetical protein